MDQMGDHMKTNFDCFQIQKWMLQTVQPEKKVWKKWGCFSSFPVSFPELWSVNCSKKGIFAELSKTFKLAKVIYIYPLKVFPPLFQKMVWFIEVHATVHEILAIKISKKMLTQKKFKKILQLQTLKKFNKILPL